MTDHTPMPVLHLLYRKEITYTLQPRFCKVDYRSVNVQCPNSTQDNTIFCKVDYRSVNVQCPNSTQDNTILMMVLEAVM